METHLWLITVDLSDINWLDRMGHPHSDKLHLIERFRRADDKTMQLNITIEDPIAYTKTWEATARNIPPPARRAGGRGNLRGYV